MENAYLNETSFPIVKNNYVIISGCSGGGKSTLLSELANRGYQIVLEPGIEANSYSFLVISHCPNLSGEPS